jgi:phage terminase large subunit-like protein
MFRPQWDGQVCSLGYDLADWIETYCCHGPGDVQGEPVQLDAEWLAFIVAAYEIDPRTGRRCIDRAVLSRPKGRAKSELAGFIAVAEAFAPVRFDGWDADGQPVGKPVVSPIIKCLATEETQAGNTFENAAFIVCDFGRDVHPEVFGGASGVRQYQSATSIYLPGGGEMVACTSGAASKDGGRETFVVPDETHLYVTNELRNMYATVARNCGKRKAAEPWMLQTTTAYKRGQGSVAESVLDAWESKRLPNQRHWLIDHKAAQGAVNIRDKAHTMRQLRYVYGAASAWMDLERIYRTMLDPTECETHEVAARYFLNVPQEFTDDSVIDPALWSALSVGNKKPVAPVLSVEVALDRSHTTIGAAWRINSKPHVEVFEDIEGTDVAARLAELSATYNVPAVAIDGGTEAASLIPALEQAGLTVLKLSGAERAAACGLFFDLACSAGLSHNGDPALAAALGNARWKDVGEGARVFSRRKSAGAIAELYAVTLALHGLLNKPPVDVTLNVW